MASGENGDKLLHAKFQREDCIGGDTYLHVKSTSHPSLREHSLLNPPPGAAPSPDGSDIRPGSTILGAGLALRPRYVTRVVTNRTEQRAELCKAGLIDGVAPCCSQLVYRHAWSFIWSVVSSTPFLVGCHILALLLGVIKLAKAYHTTAFKFSGFLTTVETLLVFTVVIIRVIQFNRTYRDICGDLKYIQLMPRAETKTVQSMREYAYSFTGVSIGILVGDLVVLLILGSLQDKYAHLGWSVMCNQLVLVVITGFSISFRSLMDYYRAARHSDTNKVVLFEALLLLREYHKSTQAQSHHHGFTSCRTSELKERVDCFLRALHGTEVFKGPKYISCPGHFDESEDLLNAITTLNQMNGTSPRPRSHSEVQL